jgi:hypothetical protein
MTIQFRDRAAGRTIRRNAVLTVRQGDVHGGEPVLVVSGGRLFGATQWVSARGRLVRATRTERANFAAWLLRGLPHYVIDWEPPAVPVASTMALL